MTTRHPRAYALATAMVAVMAASGPAWSQPLEFDIPQTRKEVRSTVVAQEEFFYYDANKMRTPLQMARGFIGRFDGYYPEITSKEKYLKDRFYALDVQNIAGVYQRAEFKAAYLPTTPIPSMIGSLSNAVRDTKLDVAPLFMIEGREAIVDGIYIETVIPESRETVRTALESFFGKDALIHELVPEKGVWHVSFRKLFFLGAEKKPLNVLSVANMIQQSEHFRWVKRAYPKFHFFSRPVVASLTVTPLSGTVGERRTASLVVRIFGKPNEITVDPSDIPDFFQSKFTPLFENKPPMAGFWEITDTFKRPRRQVAPNEWVIEHTYSFGIHAPEPEWTVSGLEIPYKTGNQVVNVSVPTVTFYVRPHLDSKHALDDMPEAFSLKRSAFPGFTETKPEMSKEWFDAAAELVGGRGNLIMLGNGIAVTGLAFALLLVGAMTAPHVRARFFDKGVDSLSVRLAVLLRDAEECVDPRKAFAIFHEALSFALNAGFSTISAVGATYGEVKQVRDHGPQKGLMRSVLDQVDLEELFREIESRQDPNFGDFDEKTRVERYKLMRVEIQRIAEIIELHPHGEEA